MTAKMGLCPRAKRETTSSFCGPRHTREAATFRHNTSSRVAQRFKAAPPLSSDLLQNHRCSFARATPGRCSTVRRECSLVGLWRQAAPLRDANAFPRHSADMLFHCASGMRPCDTGTSNCFTVFGAERVEPKIDKAVWTVTSKAGTLTVSTRTASCALGKQGRHPHGGHVECLEHGARHNIARVPHGARRVSWSAETKEAG